MEIKIQINEDCKSCKKELKYFKSLQKRHAEIYLNMNMKTWKFIDGIHLTPDYNAMGHLTNFHIERASKKFLEDCIKAKERQKKESKMIMKAKEIARRKKNDK
jgi:hypothetical protein